MASWGMFIAGILLLIMVLVRRSTAYYRGQKKQAATQSRLPTLKPQRVQDAPSDLLRWQVEMHEIARDMKAEIDTKMRALQSLIRQADEACQRLETAIGEKELRQ